MLHKKGFQLSANFLVIIILSIVMIGIGMFIFYKIMSVSENVRSELDQQTIDRLNRAMDDGSLIYIPDVTKTTTYGEYAYFGLGIRNELTFNEDFNVLITSTDIDDFNVVYDDSVFNLDNNEKTYVLIAIGPKDTADLQQYAFVVNVCIYGTACTQTDGLYTGKKQMIYVNVA